MFLVCIITATCFGILYRLSSSKTLRKTQVCIPRNTICELANSLIFRSIHTCVLCNVLPDDDLRKGPKHVAVIINIIKILLCSMGARSFNLTSANFPVHFTYSAWDCACVRNYWSVYLVAFCCESVTISRKLGVTPSWKLL